MSQEDGRRSWRRDAALSFLLVALGTATCLLTLLRPQPNPAETVAVSPAGLDFVESSPSVSAPQPEADSAAPTDEPAVGIEVGMKAPAFTVDALAGGRASLSDYRGKVVLLDFWASWCSPCKASMPILEDTAKRLAGRGLVLLGLSVDRNPDAARQFLKDNGYENLIALWQSPAAAPTAAHTLYRVSGIPRTFLIDREGIVRFAGHPVTLSLPEIERWL